VSDTSLIKQGMSSPSSETAQKSSSQPSYAERMRAKHKTPDDFYNAILDDISYAATGYKTEQLQDNLERDLKEFAQYAVDNYSWYRTLDDVSQVLGAEEDDEVNKIAKSLGGAIDLASLTGNITAPGNPVSLITTLSPVLLRTGAKTAPILAKQGTSLTNTISNNVLKNAVEGEAHNFFTYEWDLKNISDMLMNVFREARNTHDAFEHEDRIDSNTVHRPDNTRNPSFKRNSKPSFEDELHVQASIAAAEGREKNNIWKKTVNDYYLKRLETNPDTLIRQGVSK